MKKLSLLLLISGLFTTAFSQNTERNNTLSLHFGLSIPTGSYASTDKNGGFAQAGRTFQLMYTGHIKRVYLGAQFSTFGNSLNTDAYNEALEKEVGAGTSTTTASGYAGISFLSVIGYDLLRSGKTAIGAHLKVGVTSLALSSVENRFAYAGNEILTRRDIAATAGISATIGYHVKHNFSERWAGFIGMDYIIANGDFSDVEVKQWINGTQQPTTYASGGADFNNLSVNIGFGYCF